ncbi:PRC-barrel domain-containing protein [Pseudoroseomonas cervicalis]|uniref:PRC-barrel domain-containing protein n=1 Tax=Teichococcus cervicalis TaxID=204525 RepID=UPI0022F183F5|nr:PRC-barrel domain-containing protein [Pseudoroseomonas cervicalis]WBV41726.1 PRC-barrel domain-containing protein [Pseudoroseomonas cervicalis]
MASPAPANPPGLAAPADESPAWRATLLLGSELHDEAAQRLGPVVELLFDRQGRLAGLVVGLGGFLGVGTRYVTIPWPAVRLEAGPEDVPRPVYTGTPEALAAAPPFAAEGGNPRPAGTAR